MNRWAYFDTSLKRVRVWDGGQWDSIGVGDTLKTRWDVLVDVPTQAITESDGAPWFLVVHYGDGVQSNPQEYQPGSLASLQVPLAVSGDRDTAELLLFADRGIGNGTLEWMEDIVIHLGTFDRSRYQYVDRTVVRLAGNLDALVSTGGADAWTASDLVIQVRHAATGVLQWSPVGAGAELPYHVYVPGGEGLGLSVRRQHRAPVAFYDSVWQQDLGYPVTLAAARRYYSSQLIPDPVATGMKILLIRHPDDNVSSPEWAGPLHRPMRDMVKSVLDHAGLEYEEILLSAFPPADDVLNEYAAIVFVTENLWAITPFQAEVLRDRVVHGMGLVAAKRGLPGSVRDLFGIQTGSSFAPWSQTDGLCFVGTWLPGLDGACIPRDQTGYSRLNATLLPKESDGPEVLTTAPGRTPLAWRHRHDAGRTFFWNTDLTEYAQYRGLLLHSILDVLPVGAARIANAGVFQIDDYPLPVYPGQKLYPVNQSANGTMPEYTEEMEIWEFYRDVWLPDMLELAADHNMTYLFAIPFNYNTLTTPPPESGGQWPFDEWERLSVEWEGETVPFGVAEARKLRDAGHELSLHGYNHLSLLESNWFGGGGSIDTMRTSVEAARTRWISDQLGPLPTTYVAPNNRIDATGLQVLREAMPGLTIFSGDITVPFAEGGRIDYGTDPVDSHFFALPRWTSGFYNKDVTRIYAASQLALSGVWSHFVHPDDLFHNPENSGFGSETGGMRNPGSLPWGGRAWNGHLSSAVSGQGLYPEIRRLMQWNEDHFPWLQWVSTIQARDRIASSLEADGEWEFDVLGQRLVGTFTGAPQYLWIRLSGDRLIDTASLSGATVVWSDEGAAGGPHGHALYVLQATGTVVQIPVTTAVP